MHFTRDEPFPYGVREELGEGGFGYVDKVHSSLSRRALLGRDLEEENGSEKKIFEVSKLN